MISKRTAITGSALILMIFALTGCSGSTAADNTTDNADYSASTNENLNADSEKKQSNSKDSAQQTVALGGTAAQAQAAINLALRTYGSGKVYEIDFDEESSAWDVQIIDGSSEISYEIDIDGKNILQTEKPEAADHENIKEINSAKILAADAIATALEDTPGLLAEASLETISGQVLWQLTIQPENSNSTTRLLIDTNTGKIA